VPLVEVELAPKLGTGTFLFGLVDALPDFFHALVGNDLDPPAQEEETLSDNVVTRSQSAKHQHTDTVAGVQTIDNVKMSTIVDSESSADPMTTDLASLFGDGDSAGY
jgi:hypothetical protein